MICVGVDLLELLKKSYVNVGLNNDDTLWCLFSYRSGVWGLKI